MFIADNLDNMERIFKKIVFIFIICNISLFSFSETVHIVKKGETLYSISRSYGVSVESIQKANGLSGNNVQVNQKIMIPDSDSVSENSSSGEIKKHIVQKGETLYSISRTYKISVETLQKVNGLSGNNVKVGQELVVSDTNSDFEVAQSSESKTESNKNKVTDIYYTVQKGDTWLGIAIEHNLSLSEILSINNVSDSDMIKVGQRIKVVNVPDLKDNDPHNYSTKKGDISLVWPVKASDVTYVSGKVNGVALVAKKNESVKSISSGVVVSAESYRGYGNTVMILGKSGHIYAYTGLSKIHVSKGDNIGYGEEVGVAGIDAYTQTPQINLMVFRNSTPIDPAKAPRG